MVRISRHDWAMGVAQITAQRSTCLRRQVGCALVDQDGFILATGYNGVAKIQPHCNEPGKIVSLRPLQFGGGRTLSNHEFPNACPAAFAESGTQLDGCHAIHAEQNALLRCEDVRRIHWCYVTHSPCVTCVKLLMNTGCEGVFFDQPYAHDDASRELWQSHRGQGAWMHLTPEFSQQLRDDGQ